MPKAEEVATVVVNGKRFDDWETVMVQDRMHEAFPTFRFTAAERDILPPYWGPLRFAPGDQCGIYLGGKLAITGIILSRQVAYDANQHSVQLQGVGRTWAAARGSIVDQRGNYDKHSFFEAAQKVTAPFGVLIEPVGELDSTPFEKLQVQPGETLWDFLERIARPRGVIMGSDMHGKFLAIGRHQKPVTGELEEGYDIKRCQCIISIENTRHDFRVIGQRPRSDEGTPGDAAQQEANVAGTLFYYSPLLTTAEQPVHNIAELATRAENERRWNEGTRIECNITVYGWLRKDGSLWRAGDEVTVYSPMIMLGRGTRLKIETCTFTQSSESGTETTLMLRDPYYLGSTGKIYDYQVAHPERYAQQLAAGAAGLGQPASGGPATQQTTGPGGVPTLGSAQSLYAALGGGEEPPEPPQETEDFFQNMPPPDVRETPQNQARAADPRAGYNFVRWDDQYPDDLDQYMLQYGVGV